MKSQTDDIKHAIEPLGKAHDKTAFSCGIETLDNYLRRQANQDARRRVAAPFVLVERPGRKVIGFYTLSQMSVHLADLPPDIYKKLPRYPDVSVTLLGRLAIDQQYRGRGFGERLLMDALGRSWDLSREIAAMAVMVDALDDVARAFYEAYEFRRFPNRPYRLFLPMAALDKLFSESRA